MNPKKWIETAWPDLILVVLLSCLTVNRIAPAFLNADAIMISIMSLQKLTLFYWEQNRLANLLPLLAFPLRDPALNLYACMLIPCFALYGLFWFCADRVAPKAVQNGERVAIRRLIFLGLACSFFLIVKPIVVYDVAILHVEYALPFLLLGIAFFNFVSRPPPAFAAFAVSGALLSVAMGVNFSIVLPALALSVGRCLLNRKIDRASIVFAGLTVAAFVVWMVIARFHPGPKGTYTDLDLLAIYTKLPLVFARIVDVLHIWTLILVVVSVAVSWLVIARRMPDDRRPAGIVRLPAVLVLIAFACGWLLLLAASAWIAVNSYHFRYATPILFVLLVLLSFGLCFVAMALDRRSRHIANGVLVVGLVAFLAGPFVPVREYPQFKRYANLFPAPVHLFAGDYWRVWPQVMATLLQGKESFGFAFRAVAVRKKIIRHVAADTQNVFYVGCLGAPVEQCRAQVKAILATAKLVDAKKLTDDASLLTLSK
ncbi:MAG: hypothetical protein AB7G15_03090 [Alphaproteobacteria bacterium]